MNRIFRNYWKVISKYVLKRKFNSFGDGSIVYSPMEIVNFSSISIGKDVSIFHYSWLVGSNEHVSLFIEDRVAIGHFSHIIANNSLTIKKDVLIADKVFITDCSHVYKDVNIPILKQDIKLFNPVTIGEGSWIGENVCVCGASIGKHCVVGANSVVIKDIPDYCVAVGSPAKVIKKYNFETELWENIPDCRTHDTSIGLAK